MEAPALKKDKKAFYLVLSSFLLLPFNPLRTRWNIIKIKLSFTQQRVWRGLH